MISRNVNYLSNNVFLILFVGEHSKKTKHIRMIQVPLWCKWTASGDPFVFFCCQYWQQKKTKGSPLAVHEFDQKNLSNLLHSL